MNSFVNGLPDQFIGHTGCCCIGYRPGGGGDWQPGPACDFIRFKVLSVKPETTAAARTGAGYGHVNFSGEGVRKFIEGERTVMRNDRMRAGLKPGDEEILKPGIGKLGQSVDAVRDAFEPAYVRVVDKHGAAEADRLGLKRSKVTGLSLGDVVEHSLSFNSFLSHMCANSSI